MLVLIITSKKMSMGTPIFSVPTNTSDELFRKSSNRIIWFMSMTTSLSEGGVVHGLRVTIVLSMRNMVLTVSHVTDMHALSRRQVARDELVLMMYWSSPRHVGENPSPRPAWCIGHGEWGMRNEETAEQFPTSEK